MNPAGKPSLPNTASKSAQNCAAARFLWLFCMVVKSGEFFHHLQRVVIWMLTLARMAKALQQVGFHLRSQAIALESAAH